MYIAYPGVADTGARLDVLPRSIVLTRGGTSGAGPLSPPATPISQRQSIGEGITARATCPPTHFSKGKRLSRKQGNTAEFCGVGD